MAAVKRKMLHEVGCDPASFQYMWDAKRKALLLPALNGDAKHALEGDTYVVHECTDGGKFTGRALRVEITDVQHAPSCLMFMLSFRILRKIRGLPA